MSKQKEYIIEGMSLSLIHISSNMMYLTAGVFQKHIKWSKALTILLYCGIFNLIGAMIVGAVFANTSAFSGLEAGQFLSLIHIFLVPAVGTVPGFTDAELVEIVKEAHANDALVLSAIGTSQEGSSREVIEQIAIRNKVAGVDIQHIGDAGYGGCLLYTSRCV